MEGLATIAIAVVVFLCAAYVAWKITWLVLKLAFWLVALAAIAIGIWWYTRTASQPTAPARPPAAVAPAQPGR